MLPLSQIAARVRRRWQHARFERVARGVLATPPLVSEAPIATIVSMVSHQDVAAYLCAIKSLRRFVPARVVVLDDGTLTAADSATLTAHLGDVQIRSFASVPTGRCQRGGCWERLCLIAELNADGYVIQMDSDTVTLHDPREVREAIAAGRAFTLSGDFPTSPILTLEATAAGAHADPSPHMQRVAERALPRIGTATRTHFVRGCAAFAGFPPGCTSLTEVEAIDLAMRAELGDRWSEWGSEQVASNLVLANVPGMVVLPIPAYASYFPDGLAADAHVTATFLHFLGSHRYDRGAYQAAVGTLIHALRAGGR